MEECRSVRDIHHHHCYRAYRAWWCYQLLAPALTVMEEKALPIIQSVRSILLPHFGNAKAINHTRAYDASAVTELDIAVEEHLKKELTKAWSK